MRNKHTPTPPERRRRWLLTLAVTVTAGTALVLLGAATSSGDDASLGTAVPPLIVDTVKAEAESGYTTRHAFVGRVEAARESDVGFELEGLLAEVLVDEGDAVVVGEVLARLDTDRLRIRRAELVAVRDEARSALELAKLTRDRIGEARSLDAVSPQDLDEATTAVEVREAAARRAAAAVGRLDVELAKSVLTAPFNALVAARFADEGRVLGAGQAVLHLLERTRPEARIGVAGQAIEALAIGQDWVVEIGSHEVAATVRTILPVRRGSTRSVEALLTLDAELGDVRPGDLAVLELGRKIEEPGFWLPVSALTESSRGLWSVYVADDSLAGLHHLERRELELLHQEGDRAYVRGTLAGGDRVVARGLQRLVPGQRVRLGATSGPEIGR